MAKQIVHGEESRQAILRGVNLLSNLERSHHYGKIQPTT